MVLCIEVIPSKLFCQQIRHIKFIKHSVILFLNWKCLFHDGTLVVANAEDKSEILSLLLFLRI